MRSLHGIILLNTNKLIFDQDPESGYISVEDFLQKECGLVETSSLLFGQIRAVQDAQGPILFWYTDPFVKRPIFVHASNRYTRSGGES